MCWKESPDKGNMGGGWFLTIKNMIDTVSRRQLNTHTHISVEEVGCNDMPLSGVGSSRGKISLNILMDFQP